MLTNHSAMLALFLDFSFFATSSTLAATHLPAHQLAQKLTER
jgi:hypothetical protein